MIKDKIIPLATIPLFFMFIFTGKAQNDTVATLNNMSSGQPQKNINAINSIISQGKEGEAGLISYLNRKNNICFASARPVPSKLASEVTAINLLGEISSKDSLETLCEILKGSNSASKIYNSARAIGKIGKDNSNLIFNQVIEETDKTDPMYIDRVKASILGLGLLKNIDNSNIQLLKVELKNSDELTRIYAAGSLGMHGIKDGYDTALKGVSSKNPTVMSRAITALALIGDKSALSIIDQYVNEDTKYSLRKTAQLAKAIIESKQLADTNKVDFIERQLNAYPNMTEMIRWGTEELKQMNSNASLTALKSMSENREPQYARLASLSQIKLKTE
jgi:hypothetical protein